MTRVLPCPRQLALLWLLLLGLPFSLQAQQIRNPSFEAIPYSYGSFTNWETCGAPLSTPDVQPYNWGVDLKPADGNTYLGMVLRERDNGSYESVSQRLAYPFHQDSCYTFEISLAFDPDYESVGFRKPGVLRMWGGNNTCERTENFWTSPVISNTEWQTYLVSFSPGMNYNAITLDAYFASSPYYNGDILIDHIRNIQAHAKTKLFLGNDTTLCGGTDYLLDLSYATGPFLWQDGSTNSSYRVTESGKYWVKSLVDGCTSTDTINVKVVPPLETGLGPDLVLCEGEQAILSVDVANARYRWSNNSTNSRLTVYKTGTYWVEVSRGTCTLTDTIHVSFENCQFIVPNIITPNGDGLNEAFKIRDDYHGSWSLEVYNRNGKLIYRNPDYDNSWSGEGGTSGIYFYYIRSNDSDRTYKGTVTVSP